MAYVCATNENQSNAVGTMQNLPFLSQSKSITANVQRHHESKKPAGDCLMGGSKLFAVRRLMERNATRANMWRQATLKPRVLCALVLLLESAIYSQTPQKLSVPADSPRWELQGQAKVAEYHGRKCLFLNGGAAVLKDFEMRDGVIDFDMATPDAATSNRRGFAGLLFRLDKDGANGEELYLRQHKSVHLRPRRVMQYAGRMLKRSRPALSPSIVIGKARIQR
jgi:hypothetical protein